MNVCILMGSPRMTGNTATLLEPFCDELKLLRHKVGTIPLFSCNINPCTACRSCQADWSNFGCCIQDDVHTIASDILASDLMILATPIYSWYCTAPMKALLDRLVYGLNKYYGKEKGPSLWKGKKLALITTCGYPPEKGSDLWEDGIRRYCRHSQLEYRGMLVERHLGYDTAFMDEKKESHARAFARKLSSFQTGSISIS